MRENKIKAKFKELFSREPAFLIRSPGRINLIGEHTDYNEGFVLPAAIDKDIVFAVSSRIDRICHFHSIDFNQDFQFNLDHSLEPQRVNNWPDYLVGIIHELKDYRIEGINSVFGGDIPVGAGLSSSAALETGFLYAVNELFQLKISPLQMVKIAQRSENEYVGVHCGIMDQFVNLFGREGYVLKLDCRTFDYEYYPIPQCQILLFDTGVKHNLAASEYNTRRKQCEQGTIFFSKYGVRALRDLSIELLNEHKTKLDPVLYRRWMYVVQENERLLNACEDLKHGDIKSFGERMYESHSGLRDEFEVSCTELNWLVEAARGDPSVLGARMMGGGFGGCTINLLQGPHTDAFVARVKNGYRNKFEVELKVYDVRIGGGTGRVMDV